MLLEMLEKANKVMENAYVPSCHFPVGTCIRTHDNTFFVGCNYENASLPLGLCAESVAIGSMVSAGYKLIDEIVIVAKNQQICPPCGACRQRIAEFSHPNTKIHLGHLGIIYKTFSINEILPLSFKITAK